MQNIVIVREFDASLVWRMLNKAKARKIITGSSEQWRS